MKNDPQNQSTRGGRRENAGRKSIGQTVRLRIPLKTWSAIKDYSAKRGMSAAEWMRSMLERGVAWEASNAQ
jgi:predicted DNA binding CopG/RHH family protein